MKTVITAVANPIINNELKNKENIEIFFHENFNYAKVEPASNSLVEYYEKLGFLKPKRDENGYRNYTQEDVQILRKIHFLRDLDIPLEMIQTILLNPDQFQNILNKHLKFELFN